MQRKFSSIYSYSTGKDMSIHKHVTNQNMLHPSISNPADS